MSESYRIFLTSEYLNRLGKMPKKDMPSLQKKLKDYVFPQLKEQPHYDTNIKKLQNYNPETWRYRIGRYRVFYIIDDLEHIVSIVTIEQRKSAYR